MEIVENPKSGLSAETASSQLAQFGELLAASPELRGTLISPAVPAAKKRAVVSRLAGSLGLHRLLKSFLFVVIDHRRTPLFAEIQEAFQAQMDELNGVVRAEVAAAAAMGEGQQSQLTARLEALTARKVICSYKVEPALLGGAMVRMGSTRYDGSVRGQLEALRRRFSAGA